MTALLFTALWRWQQKFFSTSRHVSIELRDATYQKTVIFTCTIMKNLFSPTVFISRPLTHRIPVVAIFSPNLLTGPGTHPASCATGARYLFREWAWRWPSLSSAEVKEIVEPYLYTFLWAFVNCSRVKFTFTFTAFAKDRMYTFLYTVTCYCHY